MNTKSAQIEGRAIDFGVDTILRRLRLSKDGLLLEKMHGLTKRQHEKLFEGIQLATHTRIKNYNHQMQSYLHAVFLNSCSS